MTLDPSAHPGVFADRKPITGRALLELRAVVWGDGSISTLEAERLFEMNASVQPSPEWTDFFVEAISEYLLSQSQPRGYLSEDEATWLLRHVSDEGRIRSHAELELIVKLLEQAESAPSSLQQFALGAIEQTVLTGDGPTREGAASGTPRIDDVEVALIRRLIFAPASDGPAKVSQAEAEMLFRLKEATLGQNNSSEWKDLFVKAVANSLMAHQSYTPPSAAEESRLEAPNELHPFGHVLSGLGRGIAGPHELLDALFGENQERATARFDAEVEADAEVTSTECDWLERLFDKDAVRDEYEQALLDFLAKDGVRLF